MKARVKATGEIWDFSQIDEITFKSAINGHLYCNDELEFLEPSPFTPDYWERLKHQYAGMAMQGLILTASKHQGTDEQVAQWAEEYATALVERMKNNNNNQ